MADESREHVTCSLHGLRPMTFVCTHIAHALVEEKEFSFVIAPEGEDPCPLAWCEACDDMVVSLGGHWTREAANRAEFKMFCGACYEEARELARAAGRFRNLSSID